jgi:hypothetical protein
MNRFKEILSWAFYLTLSGIILAIIGGAVYWFIDTLSNIKH